MKNRLKNPSLLETRQRALNRLRGASRCMQNACAARGDGLRVPVAHHEPAARVLRRERARRALARLCGGVPPQRYPKRANSNERKRVCPRHPVRLRFEKFDASGGLGRRSEGPGL